VILMVLVLIVSKPFNYLLRLYCIGFLGVRMRVHSSKALLAQLRNMLYEAGRYDLANVVGDIVSSCSADVTL
jgi:hypothetical protein